MTPPAPRFSRYEWAGESEFLMSFGPEDGPGILILPPLFEELNRTRKLISDVMRALAARGVASHLPDLPGTGESPAALEATGWDDWRGAARAAARQCGADAVFAIRGGCLLDDAVDAPKTLRFAPVEGKRLIRDLLRARGLTDKDFDAEAQRRVFETGPTLLGGYPVTAALAAALRDAVPAARDDVITLRLEGDAGEAEARVEGPPLWRRAEPSGAPELAEALADHIRSRIG